MRCVDLVTRGAASSCNGFERLVALQVSKLAVASHEIFVVRSFALGGALIKSATAYPTIMQHSDAHSRRRSKTMQHGRRIVESQSRQKLHTIELLIHFHQSID